MSTIYRLQFLLIAAAAILAAAFPANAQTTLEAVKQKGVLVAGSSAEYPPFEYVADGKLVGYDVDMAEEITRRMGVKVAWEKIDFKGIVAALTAKRVDVLITALTWTPERAERIAFSDPYFDAGIGAITPRSSTIEKAEDLTGRKVGVQHGRVEAVVNPLPVLRYAVRNDSGFRYTGVWDTRVVGINARLEDKDLLAEINRHLGDLKREGFLAKLETKWFGTNQ
jgi:polar amino acid transport system substrate-binding protein